MPIDPNVFANIKTFGDYQKADQAFQIQKALQTQQLQTGDIDAQAKKLSLLGQIVGNSSIDQPTYEKSRAYAQSVGIDTSGLPDQYNADIVGRLRFAGATPTAQLSALIATQGHQLKAGISTGDVGAYGYGNNNGIGAASPSAPQSVDPRNITPAQARVLPPSGIPAQPGDAAKATSVFTQDADAPVTPESLVNNPPPPPAPASAPITESTPQFSFRTQSPGETIQAYDAANIAAQKKFELNNGPAIAGAKKRTESKAELGVKKEDQANTAVNTFGQLQQNIDALRKLSPSIPDQGVILNPEQQAAMKLRMKALPLIGGAVGDSAPSDAIASYKEISEQQVINALKQLVSSGQIRGNQFIEKIISRGSLAPIDGTTTDPGRQQILNQLEAELKNSTVNAQNQSAQINGGSQQQFQPIPVTSSPPSGGVLYGTSKGKKVYKMPDNTFIMEQ